MRGFPGIDDERLRDEFALAFGAWEEVTCNDESVGFDIRAETEPTTLEKGPREDEPNANAIVHYSAREWNELELPSAAFAVTTVWHRRNGEIIGADTQFNGGLGPFVICPDDGCPANVTDLRNVATHEAGHFLGLAHAGVANATMACSAQQGETIKRTLSSDDGDGLCAAYPPGIGVRYGSLSERQSGSCSANATARAHWGFAPLMLLALVLAVRRRQTPAASR